MATYAENNYFLSIDGTNVSAYIVSVTLSPSVNEIDITAGSGTDHMQRAAGLADHSISFDIRHDTAAGWALTLIAPGSHAIIYGPEGNATGKPKHAQTFIINSAPHTTEVKKGMVVYSVSANGADAPTTNMHASGVWA